MDELEELRRKRLQELQAQGQETPEQQQARAAEQEAAVEQLLQQLLDEDARARLTNIRLSRPDLAASVIDQLVALARQGRLRGRLTDADLRNLLGQLAKPDRDIRITRK